MITYVFIFLTKLLISGYFFTQFQEVFSNKIMLSDQKTVPKGFFVQ